MLLLRILGLLSIIVIGSSVAAFLLTRDKRYLKLAGQVAKYSLLLALALFALLAFERLIVLV